jgi:putative ABC transport system substrate-binding protein
MKGRRTFLLSLAALAGSAFAQGGKLVRVGVLVNGSEQTQGPRFEVFRKALERLGYKEGREVVFDIRWNDYAGLQALDARAGEMVRARPDIIVAWPVYAAAAAHKHTRSVPIVISGGAGAVEIGLAASFARPGGNVTGLVSRGEDLVGKRLELLRIVAPRLSRAALLYSGQQLVHDAYMQAARASAKSLGMVLIEEKIVPGQTAAPLVASLRAAKCEGFVVAWDALTMNLRTPLIETATQLRIPAVYPFVDFAREGGLISYEANMEEVFRRTATYVHRILKGASPAELPIELPTKFEIVVNMKTAKALGIAIPESLLLRADEVIQ